MNINVGELKTALSQVTDVSKALSNHLTNLADDEKVALDILTDIATIDPALTPMVSLVSNLMPIITFVIQNNQAAKPGGELPNWVGGDNHSRGSDGN